MYFVKRYTVCAKVHLSPFLTKTNFLVCFKFGFAEIQCTDLVLFIVTR